MERQLHHYGNQLSLARAVLGFLSVLATTAKVSVVDHGGLAGRRGEVSEGKEEEEEEEEEMVYTEEQVCGLSLSDMQCE